MFLIASAGRCGTVALCSGLNLYSDHQVRHEPQPRLLKEAWLKHQGLEYQTPEFVNRMDWLAHAPTNYGESFRAPNLLPDVLSAAPAARVAVIVRDPCQYIISAHFRRVLQKGNEWDATRLMPHHFQADASLAKRIAGHWVTVNNYLLDCAASNSQVAVFLFDDLSRLIWPLMDVLGVVSDDASGLLTYFNQRPNASPTKLAPSGYDEREIALICGATWDRTHVMAKVRQRY